MPVKLVLESNTIKTRSKLQTYITEHRRILADAKCPSDVRKIFNLIEDIRSPFADKIWSSSLEEKDYLSVYNFIPKNIITIKTETAQEDADATNCNGCNKKFSSYTFYTSGKHHCRCCGKIFCDSCTSNRCDNIPENLITYKDTKNWISDRSNKVCGKCYNDINTYYEISSLLNYFRIVAYPISSCLKISTLCNTWNKAIGTYLSECSKIQYYFSNVKLSDDDIAFLESNKDTLLGHGGWTMQYLKLGYCDIFGSDDISIAPIERITSCDKALCSTVCNGKLDTHDALIIINSNLYDSECKSMALDILSAEGKLPYYVSIFLPLEDSQVQSYILSNSDMFDDIYWYSNSKINKSFRERLLTTHSDRAKSFSEFSELVNILEKYTSLDKLRDELGKLSTPFEGPFGIIDSITDNIIVYNSNSKPISIKYTSDNRKKSIMFKREDLRKDAYILALTNIIYYLCEDLFVDALEGNYLKSDYSITSYGTSPNKDIFSVTPNSLPNYIPFARDDDYMSEGGSSSFGGDRQKKFLVSYKVIPVTNEAGFIEFVGGAKTITDIKKHHGTLNSYLFSTDSDNKASQTRSAFAASASFWTVITHVLGICDRHNENIMVRSDGLLFHIDYGHLMKDELLMGSMRIDNIIIEGIGGKALFQSFKERCTALFIRIRQHFNLIASCIIRMTHLTPPISDEVFSEERITSFINRRFMIGMSERDAAAKFQQLLDSSKTSYSSLINDTFHSISKETIGGTGTVLGLFSNFLNR